MIEACFISQDELFINIYQNKEQKMTTFIYDIKNDIILPEPVVTLFDPGCNSE
jgi:hypothetical protein